MAELIIGWNHLLDTALEACIVNRHLNFADSGEPNTRAGRQAFLINLGITPMNCFTYAGAIQAGPPVFAPHQAAVPKLLLTPQDANEALEDFLDRAEDFMRVSNLGARQQILTLQNAIRPCQRLTIHALSMEGVEVYADMVAGLRARYAMPKFVALEKYQNLQRAHNEPLCSFAQKLRSLHNRFTGLPIAEEAAREPLLKHVLLSRILSTLTTSVRAQAQVLFESNPDMALEVFLSRVDGFCSYSQSGSSGSQSASRFHKSMSQNRQQQRSQPCQNDPSEKVSARSASLNGEVSA
jgi:hypothetical protein